MTEVFDPAGPEFWVLVATIVFLVITWKVGGFRQLTVALDARAGRIQRELDEATVLRQEAQALLADYQKKQVEAQAEAEALLVSARAEAERFKAESVAKVQDFVARRTRMAEQKISLAEAQAVADVRSAATDAAIAAATTILSGQIATGSGTGLMTSALAEVKAKAN
jgi:F-type H+-transporting ATPase subunit b